MVVSVVPIIRLRRATDWWSYRVPSGMSCPPGSLVVISVRGHPTLGIVWAAEGENDKATEPVLEMLCPSLVHAPSRAFVEWLAETGIISLSTALYVWLPTALRNLPLTKPVRALLNAHKTWQPPSTPKPQQVILVPGERPDIASYIQKEPNWYTFESQGDTAELESWLAVARGETTLIAGRERALFAPFLNLRQVTVINPEDISYYHEQTPYLSLVDAAKACASSSSAHFTVRSHLPAPVCNAVWDVTVPKKKLAPYTLFDTAFLPLVYPELVAGLREVIANKQTAVLLLNAHDRRILQPDGTEYILPGIEKLSKELAVALEVNELPQNIHIGTRSLLTTKFENVGLTAVLSLDPLLRQSLFADVLHGLADICTLLSHDAPCFIHTRDRVHPIVSAIRNQRFGEFCLDFVHDQQTAALPPFCEQISCSTSKEGAIELYEKLLPLVTIPWQLGHPSTVVRRKKTLHTLSLFAPLGTRLAAPIRKVLAALPSPWKVERNPWFTI